MSDNDKVPLPDLESGGVPQTEEPTMVAEADEGAVSRGAADLEAVFDVIIREVAKGNKVGITGFGTFEKVSRAARTGRNPRTGEPMSIKASAQPKFKAGKGLKDAVN